MKKIFLSLIFSFLAGILSVSSAYAFCPVCVVAVGAGVGLARWLGIDDSISGLWIGGLMVSVITWTLDWFNKKNINFRSRRTITVLGYYLILLAPLYWIGVAGHPFNKLWGIDKILLGVIVGSVFFLLGGLWYSYLKKRNNNQAYFPFQKIVMPVGALVILSFIFYFITK
ncbi:MAG: Uncharacterized protein Athens071426_184 [Parcubacteria group bacterium Athens0714_26]|nr:MAG: Uncharacterized protein Athens101426_410 [Parcubacteria group bacterium Athens1014_26]TSD03587.1 MAG: Uncharacterized protein Athens071426_184 [Parcubacteria group bacterium Athens0714_26]